MKYLVLASGLTGSGKSEISRYIPELGSSCRICPEEMRDNEFGYIHMKTPGTKAAFKNYITKLARGRAFSALLEGKNVVIDSDAPTNKRRHELLDGFGSKDTEKYLVILEASPETRIQRVIGRKGQYGERMTPEEVKAHVYKDMFNWEEPAGPEGVEIIRYRNEIQEDLEMIKSDLDRRFG